MATEKCPYCFRSLGTSGIWKKHDPIFLPNGAKYNWKEGTLPNEPELIEVPDIKDRIYKGFCQICEPEIQEIQDFLKQTEIDNAIIPLTEWSPLNLNMKFQITGQHIKEMRDSVEKLLLDFGLTKIDYFNYDEEGNEVIQPDGQKIDWTDPITDAIDLKKFQVKAIHIEDLRHIIQLLMEKWNTAIVETWQPNILYHGDISGETDNKTWQFIHNNGSAGVITYTDTLKQAYEGGWWYDDAIDARSLTAIGTSIISIKEEIIDDVINRKLSIIAQVGADSDVDNIYPPNPGWYPGVPPYAQWWAGHASAVVSGLSTTITGTFTKPGLVNQSKIFTCDISNFVYTPSLCYVKEYGDWAGVTNYPSFVIALVLESDTVLPAKLYNIYYRETGPVEITHPSANEVDDWRLFSSLGSGGTITADIWQEITRISPTHCNLTSMTFFIGYTPSSRYLSSQAQTAGIHEANCVGGMLSGEFDNIGLATRPTP